MKNKRKTQETICDPQNPRYLISGSKKKIADLYFRSYQQPLVLGFHTYQVGLFQPVIPRPPRSTEVSQVGMIQ